MKLISMLLKPLLGKPLLADISSVVEPILQPGKSNLNLTVKPNGVEPSLSSVVTEKDVNLINAAFESLPADSKLREFIANHPIPIEVTGSISNDPRTRILLGKPLLEHNEFNQLDASIKHNAGVYTLTHKTSLKQYVGSAISLGLRLEQHVQQFNMNNPSKVHKFSQANGGISSFDWGVLYTSPNFQKEFLTNNPHYRLSYGEYQILLWITRFIPRVLEQSILNAHCPALNHSLTVPLQMKQWANSWLNIYNWSFKSGILVEVRDFETGNLLLPLQNSINGACNTLGVSKKVGLTYLNNSGGFLSPILEKRVTLNILGQTLENKTVQQRTDPSLNYAPLVLVDRKLIDLTPCWYYVFLPNKKDIFGTYYSVADAALHLNPSKCAGLSRQEMRIKNIAISRFCNFDKLVSTEKGEFYIAKHPNSRMRTVMPSIKPKL